MKLINKLKAKSKLLKRDTIALYLAYKSHNLPWYVKVLAIIVVGYALSPIDLIPDFIPIIGYLDDLLLIPAGIALLLRLIPDEIIAKCRQEAEARYADSDPVSKLAGAIILLFWIILTLVLLVKLFKWI